MQIGELRTRVQIRERTITRDGYGGVSESWAVKYYAWASVRQVSGREYAAVAQSLAEATHIVWIRYRSGVTPAMEVYLDGRRLEILAVDNQNEKGRYLKLTCSELIRTPAPKENVSVETAAGGAALVGGDASVTIAYNDYIVKALGYNPLAFWPLIADGNDLSGNGYHGSLQGDALIQAASGADGLASLYLDGADDYFNVYSAGLASAWNGDELCIGGWAKKDIAAGGDGTYHDLPVFYNSLSTKYLFMREINGELNVTRNAGTTQTWSVGSNFAADWVHFMMRITLLGPSMQVYLDGVANGPNVAVTGNWADGLLSTGALWGASSSGTKIHEWKGWMQYVGIFPLLSAAQILDLATI